ncbi:hypothetical protein H4582DRAFT_729899 [Lactarius indigo]|nr:hypothetical protein H4582DRAFT_729899 [Lactarius indigo]
MGQRTKVISHERNPVWDERLSLRVNKHDLSQAIHIVVLDRDKIMHNDYVGGIKITVASLVKMAADKGRNTGLYPDDLPTVDDHELPLTPVNKTRAGL